MGRGANRRNRNKFVDHERNKFDEQALMAALQGTNKMKGVSNLQLPGPQAQAAAQEAMMVDRAKVMRTNIAAQVAATLVNHLDKPDEIAEKVGTSFMVANLIMLEGMGIGFHSPEEAAAMRKAQEEQEAANKPSPIVTTD